MSLDNSNIKDTLSGISVTLQMTLGAVRNTKYEKGTELCESGKEFRKRFCAMSNAFEIKEYIEAGRSPFAAWFDSLDAVTAARIDKYIRRLEAGNFGAAKVLDEGVFELRLDFGPGYRVYYGRDGKTIIILLGEGSKRRQSADIAAAIDRWKKFKQSKK